MKKVIVRAPVRADLAGGTLDLWPLYLFHPGARTVNVAISFYAESEVEEIGGEAIEVHLTDQQYVHRYESLHDLAADPKAALIHRVLEHFHVTGIRITTRTDAPRGSGLGGSSALTVTLVRALSELTGAPFDGENLVTLVRDLETRLLGIPAGIQDYYPPVFGGLASLHLEPGAPVRHPLGTPVQDLAAHMLLHYTGVSHFSGTNNWELFKRHIAGQKKVQKGFARITATAIEMEKALEAGDFHKAGIALGKEWEARKALITGISTPEIDAAMEAARNAGAWGGKVCGAGGGGCVIFLFPPENREAIIAALAAVPGGRVLDAQPVAHGMTIDVGEGAQAAPTFARSRIAATSSDALEQLYVFGGRGNVYRPYALGEALITLTEGRSGVHHTIARSFAAPIEGAEGTVLWHQARKIDPDLLDIRVVPNPSRKLSMEMTPAVIQGVAQAQDTFRQFLAETEQLRIFHNPAFGFFSEPNEDRQTFAQRCVDEANHRIEDEAERLESTFRRRIDQLRERSEREEREMEDSEEAGQDKRQDMNVAWGQTLYNITSGRPAAVSESVHSIREVDYLESIAQIQRAWDKELQAIRDELMARAGEIEEINIAASEKNIEVTKYYILWAGEIG